MNCRELEQLLSDRVLAELTQDQRAAVAAHVAECSACRQEHGLDEQSQELHDTVKALRAEPDLTSTVMARLDAHAGRPAGQGSKDDPAIPQRLAGFEVLGFLGRGGMGNVFKARQVSMDRLVALKILPTRLARDEESVERLTREARAAAKLRHPNIVHAYDVGSADGHYYFAMEYVDGEGLDAVLRSDGPLDQDRALQILIQVTRALAAAHEAGIIHRDVKPSNIMLDSKGEVRVTDFGLAERIEGDVAATANGRPLGTPAYAAPEMLAGRAVDARADLYSLGATFFHVLAGRPPFEGQDFSEIVIKQVHEAPPALADVAPQLDPRLCQIIDRLLGKDPAERYPSARALHDELEALGPLRSAGEAARAEGRAMIQEAPTVPLSEGRRLARQAAAKGLLRPRRARRNRLVYAAAGAAVVCAAITIVILTATRGRRQREAAQAADPQTSAASEHTASDPREYNAAALFRNAEAAADLERWTAVKKLLARLDEDYAETNFYAEHSGEIAKMRAKANAALQQAVVTAPPATEAEPPKPEPLPAPPKLPERPGEWVSLFDGKTLAGWRVVEGGEFAGHGPVLVDQGRIIIQRGPERSAIAWTGDFPTVDYEVALEARREAGSELAEILFPVGPTRCAWSVAGWGGTFTGLAMLEGHGGLDNDTRRPATCRTGQWYRARLRVTKEKIEAWRDDEKWYDLPRAGRRLSQPYWLPFPDLFAVATWRSTLAVRNIRLKLLESKPEEPPAGATETDTASVAVSAKADWLDTGLFLAKGRKYEISATGRWGAHGAWNVGPAGKPRDANQSYPLIARRVYDLIGHVGEQGPAFHVGQGLELTAKHPGRLYLRMNDDGTTDNWGSVHVRVHGPLLALKGAPLLSRFTRTVAKLKVGPADGWAFSGLTLQRGDQVLISADGTWNGGPRGGPIDADGYDRTWRNQRAGALIGRIGQGGALFTVGKRHLLEARQSGKLYLAVNDVPSVQYLGPFPRRVPRPGPQGRIEAERRNRIDLWALVRAAARARERAAALRARAKAAAEQARLAAEAAANRRVRPEPQKARPDAADPAPRPAPRPPKAPQPPKAVRRNGKGGALSVTIFAPATFGRERKEPEKLADLHCRLLATLRGHQSWVICVDFSPDGTRMASASRDRTLRLWDAETGKCLKTLRGHLGTVEAVAFSPDGKRLLSTGQDRTVRLWDVTTGKCIWVLRGHGDWVRSAAFFPDGKRAASTGADRTVRIWDVASGKCLMALRCDSGSWRVTISPDGKQVASASERGWIRIWDAETGRLKRVLFARSSKCWCLAYSSDGKRLASAGDDRFLYVWDTATGKCLKAVEVGDRIRSLAFSPDGKYIAAGGWCRAVRFWDATTYEHLRSLEGHTSEVRGVAFSPDGKRLATASFDGTIKLWALEPEGPPQEKPVKP